MTMSSFARFGVAAAIALIAMNSGVGTSQCRRPPAGRDRRHAQGASKYEDPYVAVRDLYLSTVGCVHYDGMKMEGHMDYPKGAMGIHFVNLTIQGPPDPLKPNVLIYEPVGKGKLKLVAAEWLVPLAVAKERPVFWASPSRGRWKATSR